MKQKIFIGIFSVLLFVLFLPVNNFVLAQNKSDDNKGMAEMMAQMVDANWDKPPEEGLANIRILMLKDGKPFAGKVSIHTDFSFRAIGRYHHSQGFNPNKNGRWIYDGIEPGAYKLEIVGLNEFKGWKWEKDGVKVKAGDTPLYEIPLD